MSTKTPTGEKTNAEFAYNDGSFNHWCQEAGVIATKRQASKWRRKIGAAYKTMKGLMPPRKKQATA